jgi:hypothetical protein
MMESDYVSELRPPTGLLFIPGRYAMHGAVVVVVVVMMMMIPAGDNS